jgi:hypothetical protein
MLRQPEKNRIQNDISSLQKNIERLEKTNNDLPRSDSLRDKNYIQEQINKNIETMSDSRQKIEDLRERIRLLDRGDLDEELKTEIKKSTEKIQAKELAHHRRIEKINKENSEKKLRFEKEKEKERKINYEQKQLNYLMQREYERFSNFEIPDYITQNLKGMPNNKGYIWKNMWCFGELPKDSDTCVMFEKNKDVTYIHEISRNEHVIYKKEGKNPRKFVQSKLRSRIFDKK